MSETITVVLPLPNRCLSPNARPNRFQKSAATKKARTTARRETYAILNENPVSPTGFVVLSLRYTAYWKTKGRRKDDTNLIGSCKAYEDGVADALFIDDSTWSMEKPVHEYDKDNPRLVIEIEIEEL